MQLQKLTSVFLIGTALAADGQTFVQAQIYNSQMDHGHMDHGGRSDDLVIAASMAVNNVMHLGMNIDFVAV